MFSRTLCWAAAALLSAALAGTPVEADRVLFTGLVVFGDSLSDDGNAGRYSNGPVWVERMAERIGAALRPSRVGGTNYAVGGARTHGGPIDLRAQVDAFLSQNSGHLDREALYVVYGGGNDLLAADHAPDRDALVRDAATALSGIVDDLAAAGAQHILVPNLPDVGRTPAVRARGAAGVVEARRLTQAYNAALERALAEVEVRRSVRIHRLDVFALLERVVADPGAAGFRDVANPCLGVSCADVLFRDHLHPTATAHARLAAAALGVVGIL